MRYSPEDRKRPGGHRKTAVIPVPDVKAKSFLQPAYIAILCGVLFLFSAGCIAPQESGGDSFLPNEVIGEIQNSKPTFPGEIIIEGAGTFSYLPADITTVRKDIFRDGYFSIFDILVYLDGEKKIDMEYHFDEEMNTHVIDSLNGQESWWYIAYYDGGWPERNAFRMDHYPVKDRMYIRIMRENGEAVEAIFVSFREEIKRTKENNGEVIIPEVVIRGTRRDLTFRDVKVVPHHLRNDTFQDGVVTAIDTLMTLGDEGKITYTLQWYDSIGTADIVRSYYADRINADLSVGRCGFVYETGPYRFAGIGGNHIHIPSDARVLNSPEYVEYHWLCI